MASNSISVEEIDTLADKIEKCIKDVDAAAGSNVRLMKVEVDLLNHMKAATNLLQKLLLSGNRVFLKENFGDCGRIARLRSAINCINVFHFKSIDKYPDCDNACTSVEQVLTDLGYEEQLQKATKATYTVLLRDRAQSIMNPGKVEDSDDDDGDSDPLGAFTPKSATMPTPESETSAQQNVAMSRSDEQISPENEQKSETNHKKEEIGETDNVRPALVTKETQDSLHLRLETRNLFDACDPDGDGKVTLRELQRAMRRSPMIKKKLKVRSNQQCTRLFENADTDQSGSLDFDEFQAYLKDLQQRGTAKKRQSIVIDEETVQTAFEVMDRDCNGQLDIHELRIAYAYILLNKGGEVSRKKVAKWALKNIKKFDRDGTQTLDLDEFRLMLKNSGALQETFTELPPEERKSSVVKPQEASTTPPPGAP